MSIDTSAILDKSEPINVVKSDLIVDSALNSGVINSSVSTNGENLGNLVESTIVPKAYITQSYSLQQQKIKKRIKNGFFGSVFLSEKDESDSLKLHLNIADNVTKKTGGLSLECEHGSLRLYNYAHFIQTLSGFPIESANTHSFVHGKAKESPGNELLSLAIARLPKSFTDIFGFLSFVIKDKPNGTLMIVEELIDSVDLQPAALDSAVLKDTMFESNTSVLTVGDEEDIPTLTQVLQDDNSPKKQQGLSQDPAKGNGDTTKSYDSELHCMSITLSGSDISINCVIEADTRCWINILENTSLQVNSLGSQTSNVFKTRIPCVVGKVALNSRMISELNEGDILLLDESYIDESNNLGITVSGKSYSLKPNSKTLDQFTILSNTA